MGHDYMVTDELESALESFRKALEIDSKHFYARYEFVFQKSNDIF